MSIGFTNSVVYSGGGGGETVYAVNNTGAAVTKRDERRC